MADSAANSSQDLARGVKANSIADGGMILGHVGEDHVLWLAAAIASSRSAHIARTTTVLLPKASWWATRFDARGTTPVSASRPARRCVRPPSTPSHAGA